MRNLASESQTMIVVTHNVRFPRSVTDQVLFVDRGAAMDSGPSAQVLTDLQQKRIKTFPHRVLESV